MKLKHGIIIAALLSIGTAAWLPAQAHTDVGVNIIVQGPPPPVRYEVVPAPRPGYLWVPGYWGGNGAGYVWVDGHWEFARPGYVYARPEWRHDRDHWYLERGGWREARAPDRYRDAHRDHHDRHDHDRDHDRDWRH